MKFKIVTDWDKRKQEEVCVQVELSEKRVKDIVNTFFCNMDYGERRRWLQKNIK
jgi:hypothetical protein